tara:strand:+ start:6956 stop:7168 length:213 start_codon:yes stop_codon:yes gene_type:complete
MWYRFSKNKWCWDIVIGIEYTYAYVYAESKKEAIEILNRSNSFRKYSDRGLDQIDEVLKVPEGDIDKIIM